MRVGLWRTAPYRDDGVHTFAGTLQRALRELGHDVTVLSGPHPDVRKLDGCDPVIVADVKWNYGKRTDPHTLLEGVRALGPDRVIVGCHCPVEDDASRQLVSEVPRVWTNTRRNLEADPYSDRLGLVQDRAFVNPYIPFYPSHASSRAGERGLIATGRLWDKRKRVLLPVEAGFRGDYILAGSLGLFGGWVRKRLLDAGATMTSDDPSSGGMPWRTVWNAHDHQGPAGFVTYIGKYADHHDLPWQRARVHFSGVDAGWVGDPGHLEYVTLEAMDAGLNVVAPGHCARPALGYGSVFAFGGDDPLPAIQEAAASPLLDHTADLQLHDPLLFVRRLLAWSWDG